MFGGGSRLSLTPTVEIQRNGKVTKHAANEQPEIGQLSQNNRSLDSPLSGSQLQSKNKRELCRANLGNSGDT